MTTSPTNAAGDLVTVPREPTQAMWAAFRNADEPGNISFHAAYRAMLAASPAHATGAAMREVVGWSYEFHEFGDVWKRASILNRPDGGANPPTKHHGNAVRKVEPLVRQSALTNALRELDALRAALSSPAQEGEAAPVRTDADGVLEAIAAFLKDRDEAFVMIFEPTDQERLNSADGLMERLAAMKPKAETGPTMVDGMQEALEMTGCKDVANLIDMANVGVSLMNRIDGLNFEGSPYSGWASPDDPAEIVDDLLDALKEACGVVKPTAKPISAVVGKAVYIAPQTYASLTEPACGSLVYVTGAPWGEHTMRLVPSPLGVPSPALVAGNLADLHIRQYAEGVFVWFDENEQARGAESSLHAAREAVIRYMEALKPEGETGPAVVEGTVWGVYLTDGRFMDIASSDRQTAIDMAEAHYEPHEYAIRALTVSPSPSERDQHQGEMLNESALAKAVDAREEFGTVRAAVEAYLKALPALTVEITPRPVEDALRDGTMIRLLIDFEGCENWNPMTDDMQSWTVGFNHFDHDEQDEWIFVGWDWSQDCIVDCRAPGMGRVIGWLPLAALSTPEAVPVADKREGEWRPASEAPEGWHRTYRVGESGSTWAHLTIDGSFRLWSSPSGHDTVANGGSYAPPTHFLRVAEPPPPASLTTEPRS